ncbi:MAG: exodeoxyribonuclease VII small subunit [Muribaculaceae bacterium]|nr:exodeoxyribonuclease VII small subunit [Muribaculaceae bacterium]
MNTSDTNKVNETPVAEMTYTAAMTELEKIMQSLRDSSCDVDTLVARTQRAAALIEHCRSRLTATEETLARTLAALQG